MNKKKNRDVVINGSVLEEVDDHAYLGTHISKNGERVIEMKSRITQAK